MFFNCVFFHDIIYIIIFNKNSVGIFKKGSDKMKVLHVYTDGACSGNPGPGGWGFAIVDKGKDQVVASLSGKDPNTTNNKMELTAALESLKYVKEVLEKNEIKDVEI